MSQINPKEIVDRMIIRMSEHAKVQQVGIDLSLISTIILKHGESRNVDFAEQIELPDDIFALFYQRSTYSRQGIFATTGVYDPGFRGMMGCTLYNMSGRDVTIEKGTRVGQMVFFKAEAASSYNGQYQQHDLKES